MFTGIIEFSTTIVSNRLASLEQGTNKITELVIKIPSQDGRQTFPKQHSLPISLKAKAFARGSFHLKPQTLIPSFSNLSQIFYDNVSHDQLGDSIAVNGCCLTIARLEVDTWTFEVTQETLKITNLGTLQSGELVNIERAVLSQTRLGGHIVSGHVDCLGVVHSVSIANEGWIVEVDVPKPYSKYCIPKGSITINGVSLTINRLSDEENFSRIELCLIPTTLQVTNLKHLKSGMTVNIEVDHLMKLYERLTGTFDTPHG